jgi:hypothetical protein
MAFNRRRFGGVLLIIAAVVCFFAHSVFRVHAGVYLIGGALAFFFCRSRRGVGEYEDVDDDEDEFDEDEDEFDDEEEDDYLDEDDEEDGDTFPGDAAERGPERRPLKRGGSPAPAGGKGRERAFRIRENKEEYNLGKDGLSRLNEPVRLRSSKVCHVCGASVGVEHKFCYSCGTPLHTASPAETAPEARSGDAPPSAVFPGDGEERRAEFSADARPEPRVERPEESGFENEPPGEEDLDPRGAAEPVEIRSPSKIFVKPVSEENVIPTRPISISPDSSYRKFSDYTRRRKYRRRTPLRRALAAVVLLAAVGGTAWFLLGSRTGPEENLPVLPREDPQPPVYSDDIAIPQGGVTNPEDVLTALRAGAPSRGIVTGSNVNVRPDHSTAGAPVTRLNQGARADVTDQWRGASGSLAGAWYKIRLPDREGWIYGQYFQPLDARPATLPPGYTALLLKAFGSGRAGLTSHLGQPSRQTPTALTWQGLTAAFREGADEVTRLQVTSAKHVFQNGVAVGVTDETLYKSMGYPSDYRSGQLLYLEGPGQGVSVQMRNGKVQSITVGGI